MTRRQQRENAFCLIFASLFRDVSIDELIEETSQSEVIQLDSYTQNKAKKVVKKRDEIDQKIKKYLRNWKIDRINKTSLAILELAIYEMIYEEDIEPAVSINEAVELAKKFSNAEESSFVNGVLSSFIKEEL